VRARNLWKHNLSSQIVSVLCSTRDGVGPTDSWLSSHCPNISAGSYIRETEQDALSFIHRIVYSVHPSQNRAKSKVRSQIDGAVADANSRCDLRASRLLTSVACLSGPSTEDLALLEIRTSGRVIQAATAAGRWTAKAWWLDKSSHPVAMTK
jgi:hypothetical protein